MKYGFRTPSFSKSFSALTSGRFTRMYKHALNPYYGHRGMGYLSPKKAFYNYGYNRVTTSLKPKEIYQHHQYMLKAYGYDPYYAYNTSDTVGGLILKILFYFVIVIIILFIVTMILLIIS